MKRWLTYVATALSLAVLVAAATLWVRSYFCGDRLWWQWQVAGTAEFGRLR